ncbi:Sugar kinase of the NBD/HSP70 family, may contain an N-terminal HTH domain [Jannaschia faecimaris]|uniref:Sugar kinase of the NBD/HSP70 family, may contain an N-terminal HTH domain n=1 Tax=Jannaschia faecimaris TaxID=1244108 RepID=A0A1H3K3I3_9RHOB|nr:ROK family protein [Jannaschia faecimaris]SDY46084.1 Sugar kinase of the NBD/HSP70 family, may contain an N-terminal HTH domain [Jannaschia faecimaris]
MGIEPSLQSATHLAGDDAPGCGPLRGARQSGALSLRQQVYERVRSAGHISRAALAKELEVSPGSVTPLVSDLLGQELLYEVRDDAQHHGRGRPPVTLAVNPKRGLVVGLKLSDHEHSALLVDLAGQPVASATVRRGDNVRSVAGLLDEVEQLLARLSEAAGPTAPPILAVGLGMPGMIDHTSGQLRWSPIVNDRDINLAGAVSERMGLPASVDNDANLLTMAEMWFGKGRSLSDFAVVTIEYGVGLGLVVDHAPYRGAHGYGMELGHTKVQLDGALCRCGQRGCLEAYVADFALVREAPIALDGALPPRGAVLEALYHQAKDGNEAARAIFDRAARYLALGLANVANLFDPRRIILSGSRMRYDFLYAEEMLAEVPGLTLNKPPPIELNAWDDLVWARGAAALALSDLTPRLLA